MRVAGAVAVVTGASSGIGEAAAVDLARHGATIVAAARREDRLERTVAECRRHAPDSGLVVTDVSVPEDVERLIRTAEERHGRVDVVVNNAGVSLRRHARETSPEDVERLMRVNFFGAVRVTMAALPGMVERGRGAIVNIGSVAGAIPNPTESAYGASKAALEHWTHVLAVDLAGTGVHAGVVSPGPIDTEIWEKGDPALYDGPVFPPAIVAEAVRRCVEDEVVAQTVPRRYGAAGVAYRIPGLGRLLRRGLVRFAQKSM